ncbi:MAG: nucleotidyl transferase AbiEii/AbiGii toxin family protein [Phycisphaerales bacterium]|nr:nucleotidyl transferase AbiEii/AbiGii toxin family protein [Phycisphaerales bacterium]
MKQQLYRQQVALLLDVIPEIAKEKCFALHGGTAINLFIRDMPRLSVDIDLTYIPLEDRQTTLDNIAAALVRIEKNIHQVMPTIKVTHRQDAGKLQISRGVEVKLEVNLVNRGLIAPITTMQLCKKAQESFGVFCEMDVVSIGQLYGGKICAALDRQHPRDLFDVQYLLANEGVTTAIKEGFLFRLVSGERPINEILVPNLLDQRAAMDNQFMGMSLERFTYDDYETVRQKLIVTVHQSLTEKDKRFLLSIKNATPDWSLYDFERFPAIQWKLQNLKKLKETNPKKHKQQYEILEEKLKGL